MGLKLGLPLILERGWREVSNLASRHSGEFYVLADLKQADIPDVDLAVCRRLAAAGFDGAVIHLFHGGAAELARSAPLDLVGVASMSHPGARLLDSHFRDLIAEAARARLPGVVVGATRPGRIGEARAALPGASVLSPGVGVQGARPGEALRAGADFEIVGRLILRSPDPVRAAWEVVELERGAIGGRG